MRRALIALGLAGGLTAVFATASHAPRSVSVTRQFAELIVVSANNCSIAGGALQIPGPFAFNCRTHGEAERLAARFGRGGAPPGRVRGTTVVVP